MAEEKTWSYQEITDATQRRIEMLLARAERRAGIEADWLRQQAYGTYALWDALTFGWQAEGDSERLRALVE